MWWFNSAKQHSKDLVQNNWQRVQLRRQKQSLSELILLWEQRGVSQFVLKRTYRCLWNWSLYRRCVCTETLQQELGEAYKALFPLGENASVCLMGKGKKVFEGIYCRATCFLFRYHLWGEGSALREPLTQYCHYYRCQLERIICYFNLNVWYIKVSN